MAVHDRKEPRRIDWAALGAIVGLAVVVRVTFLIGWGPWDNPLAREPSEEVRLAQSIAQGLGFVSPYRTSDSPPLHPSAISPPGYPYLLAALIRVSEELSLESRSPYRAAMLVGILVASVGVGITAFVARDTHGQTALWVAGLAVALWPRAITTSYELWDTPFLMVAVPLGLLIASIPSLLPTAGRAAAVGAALGVLTLFNPNTAPFLLVCLTVGLVSERPWRTAVVFFAVATAVWLLCLVPWQIRNQVVFQRFVPIRHGLGLELFIGNQPVSDGTSRTALSARNPTDHPEERALINRLGDDAYMQLKQVEAQRLITQDPAGFFYRSLRRIRIFWLGDLARPTQLGGLHLPQIGGMNPVKLSVSVLLLAGALKGSLLWRSRGGRLAAWCGLLLLPLPFYATHVAPYYRMFVDPILLLLFGIYAASLVESVVTSRLRPGAVA